MQYNEGSIGRVFALRLEEGERIPDAVVDFAREHAVRNAMVMFLGEAGAASRPVVGPEENRGEDFPPASSGGRMDLFLPPFLKGGGGDLRSFP